MKKIILALPFLHRELYSLPAEVLTIWSGLPHQPSDTWQPVFPGSSEYAASLLSYFERLTLDGASGTSVAAFQSMPLSELSPSEQAAIRAFSGIKEEEIPPLKMTAWQIFLLSWLKEKQVMELYNLECKISASRLSLSNILQEQSTKQEPKAVINEADLPDWKDVLFALLAFLPDLPEQTEFIIQSSAMSEAIKPQLAEKKSDNFTANELVSLCSGVHQQQIRKNYSSDELNKIFSVKVVEKVQ